MPSLTAVRKLGFRRWYERQLIESHAYFVTCFVCMILVAATMEAANTREMGFNRLLMLAVACASGALGIFAWTRYKRILDWAEHVAEAANCPTCGSYGVFKVLDGGPRIESLTSVGNPAEPLETCGWLHVQCKKCAQDWKIE